jgi:hypothetical protein
MDPVPDRDQMSIQIDSNTTLSILTNYLTFLCQVSPFSVSAYFLAYSGFGTQARAGASRAASRRTRIVTAVSSLRLISLHSSPGSAGAVHGTNWHGQRQAADSI